MQNRSTVSNVALAVGLSKSAKVEFDALNETGREVLAAPPVRDDLPIVVLTAPDKSASATAAFDNAKRADFARLYPGAIVNELDGGHIVPQTRPQAVIDAIHEVLSARTRMPAMWR